MVEGLYAERFVIERFAGKGGMAEVYRAHDRRTGEPVALKILNAGASADTARLEREAHVLSEIDHPGVVRYVAHGETSRGLYLALEWLEGETLGALLTRRRLTVSECVDLGVRLAEALGALHDKGVVHRDVKPQNVMVVGDDLRCAKLLDLGIAWLTSATQITRAGSSVGTPAYMSPEQVRGSREIDVRADFFSLGGVLFEALTGRPPFVGSDLMSVLAKVLLEEPPSVRTVRADVPEALAALIAQLLEKEPADRPESAHEIARALEAAGHDQEPRSVGIGGLTGAEQRMRSLLLARDVGDSPGSRRLEELAAEVEVHGGTLAVLGEGMLLVQMSSRAHPTDQAARSARCALALRERRPELAFAVLTGFLVRPSSAPLGEVLDRGAALLERTPHGTSTLAGTILVDETSAGLLGPRFVTRPDARGLLLESELRLDEGRRTVLGKETPFVGRARELGLLEQLTNECVEETIARVAIVIGPAGSGKSRLREELVRAVREARPATEIWAAQADPTRAGSPFEILAQAIRRAASVGGGEAPAARHEKLRARLGWYLSGAELHRAAEFLGELIGAETTVPASVELVAARADARLMGDQMRRAWEDWIDAETRAGLLVLVLEDLQWGDVPSLRFIDATLARFAERPLLVVGLARPEVYETFPRLWAERSPTELRLAPIGKRAAETLARAVLGTASDEVLARAVELASGNPLYLEEILRAFSEGRRDGLPESVLAMVQARLERLSPDARRVLRAASVFGQTFWLAGVVALLGKHHGPAEVAKSLTELSEAEIVLRRSESRFPGEEELAFRHALLREAALKTLTPDDLVLGHRLAADWLEAAGESDAESLAEHFDRGGQKDRAIVWYKSAAEQALEGNDLEGAVARAERALACGASGRLRGGLLLLQVEALSWKGNYDACIERSHAALATLEKGDCDWLKAAGELAVGLGRAGRTQELEALATEIESLEPQVFQREPNAALFAVFRAAVALMFAGNPARADEILDRHAAWLPLAEADPATRARYAAVRAHRASFAGDATTFIALMREAAVRYGDIGDQRNEAAQLANIGAGLAELGSYVEAERVLREALERASAMNLSPLVASAKQILGNVVLFSGRFDEAARLEREAIRLFGAQGHARLESSAWLGLARAELGRGRPADASIAAGRAVALTARAPGIRRFALAVQALTLLARGVLAEAHRALCLSLETPDDGGREGDLVVSLAAIDVLCATGRLEEAREHARVARLRIEERARAVSDERLRAAYLESPDVRRTFTLAHELGA